MNAGPIILVTTFKVKQRSIFVVSFMFCSVIVLGIFKFDMMKMLTYFAYGSLTTSIAQPIKYR